jgi:hypothetical protein
MSTRKKQDDIPSVSPTAVETVKVITEYTYHLTTYGFGYYDRDWYKLGVSVVSDNFLRPYAKQVCKELGLPWVRAIGGWYDTYKYGVDANGNYHSTPNGRNWIGYLVVPKRNYLGPIVAPLLIVQDEKFSTTSPVCGAHGATNWEFKFNGETGKDIFENHMQFMRTDPDARKALKILPK